MIKPKKILLTTIPTEGQFVNWTTTKKFLPSVAIPLGILSLASNLPDYHEIKILDPSSKGWGIEQTIEMIEQENPDILGLSAVTARVYALNEILKKTSAPYKAVGGPHTTYYADQILNKGADAVFVGPLADLEFRSAVETLPTGIIRCNTNIQDIKFPRRELLDVKYYFPDPKKTAFLFKAENRLSMFSSTGCSNRCTFCNVQSKKIYYKSASSVVDEMQYLHSIGSRSAHILDDNFNINPKHVQGILDEMEKREFNMEWSARGQTRMRLDLIGKLAEHGFKRMHVGIEALDEDILKFFKKKESMQDIDNFCREMNRQNLDILGYFIIGSPNEKEDYCANLPKKIRELGIKYPFFNVLFPEPNTEYYQNLLKENLYAKDYWAEYMKNPTPDFEIPFPYGETRKQEVIESLNFLIGEFNEKK